MRNLYRAVPRPGKGKGLHPAKKGGYGWAKKKRNDEADTGMGWIFVLTGLGGLGCDQIKIGTTRNHPVLQAIALQHANFTRHWTDEREIRAKHRIDPPQLWASFTDDRWASKLRMSRLFVSGYAEEGQDVPMDLEAILRAMGEATGQTPTRLSLTSPEKYTNVAHITC